MSDYTCPKCHGVMRSYERNGVHVEQCTDCRGLFLDRGELEHLIAAESSWKAASTAPQAPPPPVQSAPVQSAPVQQQYYPPQQHYKRKKSFLEELFD